MKFLGFSFKVLFFMFFFVLGQKTFSFAKSLTDLVAELAGVRVGDIKLREKIIPEKRMKSFCFSDKKNNIFGMKISDRKEGKGKEKINMQREVFFHYRFVENFRRVRKI